MKRFISWALALLFGFAMFGVYAAPAGAQSMGQGACPGYPAWTMAHDWNAYDWDMGYDRTGLIGSVALSRDLEELGRVVEVMAGTSPDPRREGVNFLIVSSCLPGMEGRLVAVPYDSFPAYNKIPGDMSLNRPVGTVELKITPEEFKNAPNFSSDSFEQHQSWAQQAYRYFESIHYFG